MKEEKEKIDSLIEQNAAEQLKGVDWGGLNAAISRRLDEAEQRKTSGIGRATICKIAVSLAAAAAVLIVVMVRTDAPRGVRFEDGGKAVVKFVDSKGSASIEIEQVRTKSQVLVDVTGSDRGVAKCAMEIIDKNGDRRQERSQAAWIIIRMPKPALADNGMSRDEKDVMRLL